MHAEGLQDIRIVSASQVPPSHEGGGPSQEVSESSDGLQHTGTPVESGRRCLWPHRYRPVTHLEMTINLRWSFCSNMHATFMEKGMTG
jgi:hypothetical protein